MENKWSWVFLALLMVILVFSFVKTVFRSEDKKFSHGRIFVDYSARKRVGYTPARYNYSGMSSKSSRGPNAYKAAREARSIQRKMFNKVVAGTVNSYDHFMGKAFKGMPAPNKNMPKPRSTPQYEKMIALYQRPLPSYQEGVQYFGRKRYSIALKKFNRALEDIDREDIKHKIDIFSMIAECYLNKKNSDGYIEYKIKEIRMNRKLKKILEDVFPSQRDKFKLMDWSTTQQASKRMLKIKSMASRMSGNARMQSMVLRAKLDLEVSRKVSR